MSADLPIHSVRAEFEAALAEGPVVLSSPTGSGKSTEVPRFVAERYGRVLVVEPRRVACRTLAARVAELERGDLGGRVGYVVRDESMRSEATRILYATPGIVLRSRELASAHDVLILDEFHERSLDLDLLLALFAGSRGGPRLVVMSATLEGDRVAAHVGGRHVQASGRTHPVDVRYVAPDLAMPDAKDLVPRVLSAVARSADDAGDVLVFLPGKGEIEACARALRDGPFDLVELHGGLSMSAQRQAFEPSRRRKLVLATNVAETSITIPGIGVVIDTGLVRRTRYHEGRAYLALSPIADDSAAQRAGRAGRTGPGVAYRLWSRAARLAAITPPEIHRESLVPLVMSAAAWGRKVEELPLLDAPKPYALEAARTELVGLGAVDADSRLTTAGRELFDLPLDAPLAKLLIEARSRGTLDDAIDLVSVLSVGRPLFVGRGTADDPLRTGDCDATAMVRAIRTARAGDPGIADAVLGEARRIRARLRRSQGLTDVPVTTAPDREALVRTAMAADPRSVHVVRLRGRAVALANGGTELELDRDSLLRNAKDLEAAVVFESRAFGAGTEQRVVVTCASPVSLGALDRAGFGQDRLESVRIERGRVVATIERVHAKKVIGSREETPRGELAREAIATLFLRGSIFKDSLAQTKERLARTAIAARLGKEALGEDPPAPPPELEVFVRDRLLELGIEGGDDLALLSAADLLAPDLPFHVRSIVERDFPRTVDVGDARYEAEYDLDHRRVVLRLVRGQRKEPPPLGYLPKFPGLGIVVMGPSGTKVLRGR